MHHREVAFEKGVADDRRHAGVEPAGQIANGLFEFGGAQIVGRRIDEIARKEDGLRHAFQPGAVHRFVDDEIGRARSALSVALEAIGAEQPAKRCNACIADIALEAIIAARQQAWQFADIHRLRRLVEPVEGAGNRTARVRHQTQFAGRSVEACCPCPARGLGGNPVLQRLGALARQCMDGDAPGSLACKRQSCHRVLHVHDRPGRASASPGFCLMAFEVGDWPAVRRLTFH